MSFFDKKAEQTDGREGVTLIGEEATFHGVLSAKGSLRVDGYVEGDISDAVSVEVGKKGRIKGNIATEVLSISGQVEGDINATRSLELLVAGRLTGNVKTARLRIEEGASFNGTCKMSPHEEPRRGRHGGSEVEKLAAAESSAR